MLALSCENVAKTYDGVVQAVKDLSLEVKTGEIFGFLGPNGSGKTTSIKLFNGLLAPNSGSLKVLGLDPKTDPLAIRKQSGVVTENSAMYEHLTGFDNLMFYSEMFGLSKKDAKTRSIELLAKLGLEDAAVRKLKTYSTGMRQRLSLARALLHRPKVLFLDEPTSGLDPHNVANVNEIIRTIAATEEVTVFLCTHQLRYAQEICTSYGLINNGNLLASGTFNELMKAVRTSATVEIEFKKNGARVKEEFAIQSEDTIPKVVAGLVNAGAEIYEIMQITPKLEDIYFKHLQLEKVASD